MMVIQLPEWDGWRIAGEDHDWQLQVYEPSGGKDNGPRWRGTNFWPNLESAIGYAYERTLRECGMGHTVDMMREALVQCEKTKSALLRAVRKAVSE